MSDPSIEEQVEAYCDPDQDTPVRPSGCRASYVDYDWSWGDETGYVPLFAGPPAVGHETVCICCGVLLWSFSDDDKACRTCEQGWEI